jgi:hypothetical protein
MCRHISRETPYDRPHCRLRTLGTGPMETKAGTAMATPSIAPNASTREVENMTSISDEHDRLRCLWVSHWRLWRKLHARYDQEMEVWWDVPWPQCRLVPKPPHRVCLSPKNSEIWLAAPGPGQARPARDVTCTTADVASCTAVFQLDREPNGASGGVQKTDSRDIPGNEPHESIRNSTILLPVSLN